MATDDRGHGTVMATLTEERVLPLRGLRLGRDEMLTSKQVSALLGVSTERVMQFIRSGRLEARKEGRDWFISKKSALRLARLPRPRGRPRGWHPTATGQKAS